ncbi:MAG TPA: M28 family peptidase [Blastocatellia bacterium]|nr:M28 family peptidase [Blastocatellia bacterium]
MQPVRISAKAILTVVTILVLPGSFIARQAPKPTAPEHPSQRTQPALSPKPVLGHQKRMTPEIQQVVREISAARIQADIEKLVGFYTRQTLSDTGSPTRGIGAARRWIKSEFERYSKESGGRLEVAFDEFMQPAGQRNPKPVQVVNVVATLPGTQPESAARMYVVSGHYDSRVSDPLDSTTFAPGANDDASGTAAVMEMARVMSKHRFAATIVFMAVAGEEQGLYGSTHWALSAKARNLDIEGMITNDIIGSSHAEDGHVDNTHVRLFAEGVPYVNQMSESLRTLVRTGGENDSIARELARKIKESGEQYVPYMHVNIIYRRDRYLRGGDHSPFLDQGYAAVRMTEPNENFHHQHQDVRKVDGVQYGDLPEFDDFDYIARVARVNAAALASLALAPAPPKDVRVQVAKLENDTTLQWDASTEPGLAGYIVVWRETTAPYWQYTRFVGKTTTYTVKGISKDNYIFGVEAAGKDGNTSQAVYPHPSRPSRQ